MIFIFGERIKQETSAVGEKQCTVCAGTRKFSHVRETNYFHLFGLRLLPLEKIADYQQCDYCESAFEMESGVPELPSQVPLARSVIAYILTGYGMQDHLDLAVDVAKKVTGFEVQESEIKEDIRAMAAGRKDLFSLVKEYTPLLNMRGKQQVIEVAFLATHACCEIQYEDRLRINMIANAMDASIAFVNATIEQVRRQSCYGVRRILPTQTQA